MEIMGLVLVILVYFLGRQQLEAGRQRHLERLLAMLPEEERRSRVRTLFDQKDIKN